jgi:hypothetical protein
MANATRNPNFRQDVEPREAGCVPKRWQGVAVRFCSKNKIVSLLALSPLASCEAASHRPAKRRYKTKSGRRDSNSRQPAWKAGTHRNPAKIVSIGLEGQLTHSSKIPERGEQKRSRTFFTLYGKKGQNFFFLFFLLSLSIFDSMTKDVLRCSIFFFSYARTFCYSDKRYRQKNLLR